MYIHDILYEGSFNVREAVEEELRFPKKNFCTGIVGDKNMTKALVSKGLRGEYNSFYADKHQRKNRDKQD